MRVLATATRQRPRNTPWGVAEHTETYGDGITFCSTSSHGGFKLSAARMAPRTGLWHYTAKEEAHDYVKSKGHNWMQVGKILRRNPWG